MKNFISTSLLFLFILLFSCEPKEEVITPNGDLLFPNTYELDIKLTKENLDSTLFFDLKNTEAALIFIGIFEENPIIVDGELGNKDALIWAWEGSVEGNVQIKFSDGIIESQTYNIVNKPECIDKSLFWAAWGWEGNARRLLYSTLIRNLDLDLHNLPDVQFVSSGLVDDGDENQDGYISAGEEVTIQLVFTNYGESTAKGTEVELSNVSLVGLPPKIILQDIAAGATVSKNITFTIPAESQYNEIFSITTKIRYNECLLREENIEIPVDGINVCLTSITVTEILYLPPLIFWDPAAILPIYFAPDLYNILFLPDGDEVIQSITIQDANDDGPIGTEILAQWPVYDPCVPLKLNKPYTFQVWDEDFWDEDDFVGEYTFRPEDFLLTQDTLISLQTELIRFELKFSWGN